MHGDSLRQETYLEDIALRFLIGGAVVSLFSVAGDSFSPKSFSGIFAAAPTIALATAFLTLRSRGPAYLQIEARSMLAGALGFFLYACTVSFILMRYRRGAVKSALALLPVWGAAAAMLWALWLRW